MNKEKLEKIKTRIKHYTPEIIVTASVVTAVAVAYAYKKGKPPFNGPALGLTVTTEEYDLMTKEDVPIHYETPTGSFVVSYQPK